MRTPTLSPFGILVTKPGLIAKYDTMDHHSAKSNEACNAGSSTCRPNSNKIKDRVRTTIGTDKKNDAMEM